mmetsp:Transcript_101608/g.124379  ORF Transcript_101608/g.124379 Transcript_101608/m.124379 type:complete len:214 (-) Transcript_101608:15-656(-)
MPVIIAALRNARGIGAAQLALLTTTAMASLLHASLHRFLPDTLQTLGAIHAIAGVLGRFRLRGFASVLGIFPAQLALLTTTTLAGLLHASLHIFIPGAAQTLGAIHTIARARGHLRLRGLRGLAGGGFGIFPAQLALLTATALAGAFNAIIHTSGNGLGILSAQLALLPTTAFALLLDAVVHCGSCSNQQQEEDTSHGHGRRDGPGRSQVELS